VANFILIPRFGITGASAASLISYTLLALLMLVVSCRLSHLSPLAIVVPGKAEVRILQSAARRSIAHLRARIDERRRGARPGGAAGEIHGGSPS